MKNISLEQIIEEIKEDPFQVVLSTLDNYLNDKDNSNDNSYGRVGEGGTVYQERIRFKAYPSIKFKPSDIEKIKLTQSLNLRREHNGLIEIHSNVFHFYYYNGLFPHYCVENFQELMKNKELAYIEFINIFNHIFMGFMYQIWRKSALDFPHLIQNTDNFNSSPFLSSNHNGNYLTLSGFKSTGFDANRIFFSHFISQNRSQSILKEMIAYFIRQPVKIVENVLEKISPVYEPIFDEESNERNLGDEEGIPLWESVPVTHTKFKVVIGPLSHKQYRQFVPWGPTFKDMCRLIEDYLDCPWLSYEFEFLVTDTPEFAFGKGLVFGFDAWSKENSEPIQKVTLSPVLREENEIQIRKKFGVTGVADGEWPQDIYNSKIHQLNYNKTIELSDDNPKINKPEYFYSDISTLEETKQEQALKYIDREMDYISTIFRDYAAEFPQAAQSASIELNGTIYDRELLQFIQFYSFVAAQIRQQNDRTQDDKSIEILKSANPNLFLPIPATMIVKIKAVDKLDKVTILPKGSKILVSKENSLQNQQQKKLVHSYIFTTCYETQLVPIEITKIFCTRDYLGQNLRADLFDKTPTSIVIELNCMHKSLNIGDFDLDFLRFYINLPFENAYTLHDMLFMNCVGMSLYDISSQNLQDKVNENANFIGFIPSLNLDHVGFQEDEEVIPRLFKNKNNLNTPARHLMREFSLYPQKFMFFDVKKLKNKLKVCGKRLQLRIFLKNSIDFELLQIINSTPDCLQVGATPVVNLFNSSLNEFTLREYSQPELILPVLNEDAILHNVNVYPYCVEKVHIQKKNFVIELKNNLQIQNPFKVFLNWKYYLGTLFSNPIRKFSHIHIQSEMNKHLDLTGEKFIIESKVHNEITLETFSNFEKKAVLGDSIYAPICDFVEVNQNSFLPTQQNPHLVKAPHFFSTRLNMSHFYYENNLATQNIRDYLNHFVSKKGDAIDKFIADLKFVQAEVIAGEGRFPPKEEEIFITNGLKFNFNFQINKKNPTKFYLLTHILAEHLQEITSCISFLKLSYSYYPAKEIFSFKRKIYLGKREY